MITGRVLAFFVVIALGTLPLTGFVSQAAVPQTQILDSLADIIRYDFSGDYIAYFNPAVDSVQEVKLYNYKTDNVQTIATSSNLGGVAINGNNVLYTDRSNIQESKLMLYNVATAVSSTINTYQSYFQYHMDVGDNCIMYTDTTSHGNYTTTFVKVVTLSGTEVWSRNETDSSSFDFNINNGFAMYSDSEKAILYNIASDRSFVIQSVSGGFVESVDTDGTTVIFRETGSYPNEFTKLVTYDIVTTTKKSYNVPNSASMFRICNGMIYYIDGTFGNDRIYWMNVGGTGVEQVSDSYVQNGYLVVEAGKAIVKDPNDWSILHLYDTAGMGGGTTPPPTTGNVIGTLGGTVSQTGATLDVPAGSLDRDVEFSINSRNVISDSILAAFDILPNDIIFDPAATLTLDIPGTRAAGNELMRLENGQWVAVTSAPSNDGNSLIAQITRTGTYAISLARDTIQQVIGTAGGTLILPDVSLNIPLNALANTATVALEEIFVEGANVAQAVAVNLGGAILSIPAQLNFDIPTTMDQATAQVGKLIGTSWIAVESTLNSAGQLVADITEGGIYALLSVAGDSGGGIIDIPFPSGIAVLAVLLTTGLAMAVVDRRRRG